MPRYIGPESVIEGKPRLRTRPRLRNEVSRRRYCLPKAADHQSCIILVLMQTEVRYNEPDVGVAWSSCESYPGSNEAISEVAAPPDKKD